MRNVCGCMPTSSAATEIMYLGRSWSETLTWNPSSSTVGRPSGLPPRAHDEECGYRRDHDGDSDPAADPPGVRGGVPGEEPEEDLCEATELRQSDPAPRHQLAALGARGAFHGARAAGGRPGGGRPGRRAREGARDVDDRVAAAARERLRRLDACDPVQVARGAAVPARLAFALEPDPG